MPEEQTNGERDDSLIFRNNGISFLSIPSKDNGMSADFYKSVFGWKVQLKTNHVSFEDGTGHVIGHLESKFPVAGEAGIVPFIYVDQLKAVIERILTHGGKILKQPYAEGDLTVALFTDPSGNALGIWQHGTME